MFMKILKLYGWSIAAAVLVTVGVVVAVVLYFGRDDGEYADNVAGRALESFVGAFQRATGQSAPLKSEETLRALAEKGAKWAEEALERLYGEALT